MRSGSAAKQRKKAGETMEDVKVYTVNELAAILKVHRETALRYCEKGKIRARKVAGRWLVTDENLRRFLDPDLAPAQG